jgi:hypothetical protein
MSTINDPELEAISGALHFLVARAGQGAMADLPRNPFAALERLRPRLVPPVPTGWLLEIYEYGAVPGFVEEPGFTAVLMHGTNGDRESGRRKAKVPRSTSQCRRRSSTSRQQAFPVDS